MVWLGTEPPPTHREEIAKRLYDTESLKTLVEQGRLQLEYAEGFTAAVTRINEVPDMIKSGIWELTDGAKSGGESGAQGAE